MQALPYPLLRIYALGPDPDLHPHHLHPLLHHLLHPLRKTRIMCPDRKKRECGSGVEDEAHHTVSVVAVVIVAVVIVAAVVVVSVDVVVAVATGG